MVRHNIITMIDETGSDPVGDYLDELELSSLTNEEDKVHRTFLQLALERLADGDLEVLCREMTQLDIIINGRPRTKRYQLIKLLGRIPIYELRYGMNRNEHLRLLFFPFQYKNQSFFVFTKVVIKTLIPNVDTTNQMRDLTHALYLKVMQNPKQYLEVEE